MELLPILDCVETDATEPGGVVLLNGIDVNGDDDGKMFSAWGVSGRVSANRMYLNLTIPFSNK